MLLRQSKQTLYHLRMQPAGGCGGGAADVALYPTKYNYNEAVYASNFFYNAQRVGTLPLDNSVPWRSNALTYETVRWASNRHASPVYTVSHIPTRHVQQQAEWLPPTSFCSSFGCCS